MRDLSVIMATYNENLMFLKTCIDSVLRNTFQDFEFIIVVDSDKKNINFLDSVARIDNRIKIFKNESRLGVSGSRNRAILESSGRYIAIIDGDDYCDLRRFERQLKFLENNPDVSVVGSNIYLVDEDNNIIGEIKYPEVHKDIKKHFLLMTPIANPSVMLRRKDLEKIGLFNNYLSTAEDLELWLRFLAHDKIIHNLQENLVYYRIQTSYIKKRGNIHWKNNYTARKRHSKFIWPLHQRFFSMFFYFVISRIPNVFRAYLLNPKIVNKIKNIKTH